MRWSIVRQIWDDYEACGDVELFREDILTSPWYKEPDDVDDCLLRHAIEACDLRAVRMLLSIGESPSKPFKDGFSFLHIAVESIKSARSRSTIEHDQALKILTELLEFGADPNVLGMDGAPLHRAAGFGCTDAAQVLLSHGADIELRTLVDGERTPLIHAALMRQAPMVRFLLSAGARKDMAIEQTMTDAPTTLPEVLKGDETPIAKDILNALAAN